MESFNGKFPDECLNGEWFRSLEEAQQKLGSGNVIQDQYVRLRALRCWFMTQRNVAAWIAGVHGFMKAESSREKKRCRDLVEEMMHKEIANTRALQELLEEDIEFMALTDQGETPLVHGENLKELLEERIRLMERHQNDEPHIDPDYMEKRAAEKI